MNILRIIIAILTPATIISTVQAETPQVLGVIYGPEPNGKFGSWIGAFGDYNDDGYDDIFIGENFNSEISLDYAFLYPGGMTVIEKPIFSIPVPQLREGTIADIDGDGFNDLILSEFPLNTQAFFGGPDMDSISDVRFGTDSLQTYDNGDYGMDFNHNGRKELVIRGMDRHGQKDCLMAFDIGSDIGSIPNVIIYPTAGMDKSSPGFMHISGDFNGDNHCDMITTIYHNPIIDDNYGFECLMLFYLGSPDCDTIPDVTVGVPRNFDNTQTIRNLGDINNDTCDDIFVIVSHDSSLVYLGAPEIDTTADLIIHQPISSVNPAGDINGDGYADFIVGIKSKNMAQIYYGGANPDTIPDLIITNNDIPGEYDQFGLYCNGIGDFNGDGRDDFAVSAIDNASPDHSGYGVVIIFSGL